jgi:nucleoid DNA-binding protein
MNVQKREIYTRIKRMSGCRLKMVDIRGVVNAFLEEISVELERGNKVELRNFGVFKVRDKRSRPVRNPKNGVTSVYPAYKTTKFKPSKRLRRLKQNG